MNTPFSKPHKFRFCPEKNKTAKKWYCGLDSKSSRRKAHRIANAINHLSTLFGSAVFWWRCSYSASVSHGIQMHKRCPTEDNINTEMQGRENGTPSSIQTFCSLSIWHKEGREQRGSAITAIIRKPLVLPCRNKWKHTHTFVMYHFLLVIIYVGGRKKGKLNNICFFLAHTYRCTHTLYFPQRSVSL